MAFGVTNLLPDVSTAANFREWCQWMHDSFVAAGWTQTADTGQIVIASAAAPTATQQTIGYEVWRMNDALHAAGSPVYVKVYYGDANGGGTVGVPGAYFEVGFSTDGAGNINSLCKIAGGTWPGTFEIDAPAKSVAARYGCYFSGGTNRILFHPYEGAGPAGVVSFISIERTKNDDGTDSADGVIVQSHALNTNPAASVTNYGFYQQVALRADANAQPLVSMAGGGTVERGFALVSGSLLYGANENPLPWLVPTKRGYENPPRNFATYYNNEAADGSIQDVTMYGVVQKMRCPVACLKNAAMTSSMTIVPTAQMMYRYGD